MSDRFSPSSTKYGPSVSCGRTTQVELEVAADEEEADEVEVLEASVGLEPSPPHAESPAAAPIMKMTLRRVGS
jgi:hypothetical protein